MKIYPLYLSVILLTGCVTTQSFQSSMNRFVGQPASALTHEFGQPTQQLLQAGKTILVFQPVQLNIPLTPPTTDQANPAVISPSNSESFPADCRVFFTIEYAKVTNWYSQGKDCPGQ
ncbi:hypothetical protein ACF3NA_09735 [Alkanindiges sp. WGS2144]|uniref:hypothetical protein n=1 Tax=Alkanindiges sp. WGS2144 TaxID=3366808 RepID=UPI0037514E7E